MSIPLTFRAYRGGEELFESAIFCGVEPGEVEALHERLIVEKVEGRDGTYILYNKSSPNQILAFIDFTRGVYYPEMGALDPEDSATQQRIFKEIQGVIGLDKALVD